MKLLLCGANGRVGSEIARRALVSNINLVATRSSQLDITNYDAIFSMVKKIRPDIVINATGYVDVDNAETNAEYAYKINQDGPRFFWRNFREYSTTF